VPVCWQEGGEFVGLDATDREGPALPGTAHHGVINRTAPARCLPRLTEANPQNSVIFQTLLGAMSLLRTLLGQ
jgi:hypothetical protein